MNAQIKKDHSIVTEIAEYSQTAAALSGLRHRYSGVAFNVTTTKGMDEAKKARQEVKGYRTALEAKRKEIKAPALDRCRLIDDEAKAITAALLELEEPIDTQIKVEEARKEAEKAAKAEAERMRVAAIRQRIAFFTVPPQVAASSAATIRDYDIPNVEGMLVGDDFEEFRPQAEAAKSACLDALRKMLDAAIQREAEQARIKAEQEAEAERLAAERAELERLRAAEAERVAAAKAEQDAAEKAQAAKLAAERAAQEAELRKQREAQEAELRAQREAQAKADAEAAATRRAEEARLAAERAELARQRDEAAAAQRAAEDAKHAADMRIRGLAHEMLAALKDVHPHIADDELRAHIGGLIAKAEGA